MSSDTPESGLDSERAPAPNSRPIDSAGQPCLRRPREGFPSSTKPRQGPGRRPRHSLQQRWRRQERPVPGLCVLFSPQPASAGLGLRVRVGSGLGSWTGRQKGTRYSRMQCIGGKYLLRRLLCKGVEHHPHPPPLSRLSAGCSDTRRARSDSGCDSLSRLLFSGRHILVLKP